MRFVAAFAGLIVSIPPLIFFWVGAQTFVKHVERGLAFAMVIETAAMLALWVGLLFTPSVQRLQATLLIATVVAVILILVGYHLSR